MNRAYQEDITLVWAILKIWHYRTESRLAVKKKGVLWGAVVKDSSLSNTLIDIFERFSTEEGLNQVR